MGHSIAIRRYKIKTEALKKKSCLPCTLGMLSLSVRRKQKTERGKKGEKEADKYVYTKNKILFTLIFLTTSYYLGLGGLVAKSYQLLQLHGV